jgi:hypothetical protein
VVLRMRRESHGTALEVDPRAALAEVDVQEIRSAMPGARGKKSLASHADWLSLRPKSAAGTSFLAASSD